MVRRIDTINKERGFCMWGLVLIAAIGIMIAGADKLLIKKERKQGAKMFVFALILFLTVSIFAPSTDDDKSKKEVVAKEDEQQTEEVEPPVEEVEEIPYDPDDYTKYWTELFSMHEGLRYNMSYIVSENYSDGNENFNWFYENNTERTASVVVASRVDAPAKGFDVEAYSKNGGSFSLDVDGYYDVIFFYDDDTIERVPLEEFVLKD